MQMTGPKLRKCKNCPNTFQQFQSFVQFCSPACGTEIALKKLAKIKRENALKERRADKVNREKQKTRGEYIAEAQTAFNQFVRARDRKAGYACISSGRPLDWTGNAVDAGHYRSRGSAPHLRYDERNCHSQTKQENRYASGNVTGYRIGLIARIGLAEVEELEADQTPRRYTIEELKEIKKVYTAKARQLLKDME